MKTTLLLIGMSLGITLLSAQHTEIEFESTAFDPHIELKQTSSIDQYARMWFTNTTVSDDLWSIRAGSNSGGDSDFDIRFFETGQTVKSLMQLDGIEEEAIFTADILADGKGIFHRTDNLTQFLDIITSGANADSKIRLGSGGSVNSQIGWDPGDSALKLIPDAFSFTNGGLIIKDTDEGVRYGFNTAPTDQDRVRIAFDPSGSNEAHLNLVATGTGDFARLKLSESTGFVDHEFNLLGGLDGSNPRFYISYAEDGDGYRMMSFRADKKEVQIGETIEFVTENPHKGGVINVKDSIGGNKVRIFATPNATNQGGWISMFNQSNTRTVLINADENQNAGQILLSKSDGTSNLQLDANWGDSGLSRVVTDELELNGGSDFAENFDITSDDKLDIKAGYIVSINPDQIGQLKLTSSAYDTKVAGIISGANGIRPGLMMGQDGSIADGEYPVALTGRVYVHANQENGEIAPGDLLTSSNTIGEAMKAKDPQKSFGSIIGKAMTTIDENGYVLVLVNLQ